MWKRSVTKINMEICKYCAKPEDKINCPCLQCRKCGKSVHLDCLRSKKTPGNFCGDIFFEFLCADCSHDKTEVFKRDKILWLFVVTLALNHLSKKSSGISNHGYFHWKTHLSPFVINNWELIFESTYKRKKNISGSFSGILSNWSNIFFESGVDLLKENGWWKIINGFSPALIKYIYFEFVAWKQKERKNSPQLVIDKSLEIVIIRKILSKAGFDNILSDPNEYNENSAHSPPCSSKSEDISELSNNASIDPVNSDDYDDEYFSNYLIDCDDNLIIDNFDDMLLNFDDANNAVDFSIPKNFSTNSILDQLNKLPDKSINVINDVSQTLSAKSFERKNDVQNIVKKGAVESSLPAPLKGLLCNAKHTEDLPWLKDESGDIYNKTQTTITTEYMEIQTLNHLNNLCKKAHYINVDKNIIRHRAKLSLRRLKRNRRKPLFNLDNLVAKLAYYPTENNIQTTNEIRVLDQFHVSDAMSSYVNLTMRLITSYEISPFISPYSGKLLKPYIWRDNETSSPWLKLMQEIRNKVNKGKSDVEEYKKSSLDYCYVRPQHIASINSLCARYFWPGINLSDTLLYPEFSCVAVYKKIVVGFAFLVPDVTYNEAYISFILTRPEWRKCGVASVMLYHLTQTCIDKDITLHVSPSNPAVFLYQKFGFKVEEFLQEFYDKYLPADSKECKHALRLRLCRS